MYNKAWLSTIAPRILLNNNNCEHSNASLIAWDFVTHHPRKVTFNKKKSYQEEQLISVKLERGHIDLGSFIVKKQAYLLPNQIRFLNFGIFTKNLFARDFITLRYLMTNLNMSTDSNTADGKVIVHNVLMFHQ